LLSEKDLDLQSRLEQGWFRQQLIKLKMATIIESSYYLVLDADVICCKPVSYAQLIPDGRALLTRAQKTTQPDWWKWAGHLLGTPPRIWKFGLKSWKPSFRTSGMGMGVTPGILSTRHTLDLIDYLQDLWRLPLGELLSDHRFTEYTLYYLYLEMNGLVDQVHQSNFPVRCSGSGANTWHKEQFEQWNVDRLFTDLIQPGFFTVCQSNTVIPAEAVWRKVSCFLDNHEESV
jgi:hypothetical protein